MHTTISFAALALALSAAVQAFHVESGTACTTVGSACSYVSDDSSAGGSSSTTVHGFCASDLHCASNGAKCGSDDDCYNYCGSGICGGQGAGCNSQDSFAIGQPGITCGGTFTCSVDGAVGECLPSGQVLKPSSDAGGENKDPTPSMKARRHRRRSPHFEHRQVRAADLRNRS